MKTLAQHLDASEIMDGTFSKPRYKMTGESFVSIESELSKFQRKQKIKSFFTKGTTSFLGFGLTAYVLASGSLGVLTIPDFKPTLYPAFANEMSGGFVNVAGTTVYASKTVEAPKTNIAGFIGKVQLAFIGAEEGIIGNILNTNTLSKITIQNNSTVTYSENSETITTQGQYRGENRGEYVLKNEYVVECISGACEPGEIILLPAENIIGVIQ